MKNKIKVKLAVGHDKKHSEQTKLGVLIGKDVEETVYLTKKDAQSLLQNMCDRLDYQQSRKFVREYSK
jgi:hypothetical protein